MTPSEGKEFEEFVRTLLQNTKGFSDSSLDRVEHLAGDGSGRNYFRLSLGGRIRSAVLLLHGVSKSPALAGDASVDQESSFEELSLFFKRHGIAVPALYHHDLRRQAFLVEDVGNQELWRFVSGALDAQGEEIAAALGLDFRCRLFQKAVDTITQIQSIPVDRSCVAFRRHLGLDNYRREISEFIEFYAGPRGLRSSERRVLEASFDAICETIISFPKILVHFDFNAWNLFVSPDGGLRVLDYQDACLASPARDIVSLINDRGMDEMLGKSLHTQILQYYYQAAAPSELFSYWYDMTLLHWDFRVAGRFLKLCKTRNTERYQQWVPGTVRRLGRTLVRSYRGIHGLEDVLEILRVLSPEIREGSEDPWPLPEFSKPSTRLNS